MNARASGDGLLLKSPSPPRQVIAGQLAGTLFNTESARMVELETQAEQNGGGSKEAVAKAASKNSARDAALRARDASRTLQSLPSEVAADGDGSKMHLHCEPPALCMLP